VCSSTRPRHTEKAPTFALVKTSAYAGQLLGLYLNATPIGSVADNTATTPLTSTYVSLHTADPGVAGNQGTNEVAYTGYARVAVARTPGSPLYTVTGNQAVNSALIAFAKATGVADNAVALFAGIGDASSGAGVLRYSGPLATLLGPGTAESADNTIRFGLNALTSVVVGQKIIFIASPNGVTPGGVVAGTVYFVKTVSGDQLTISATSGGATLTISGDGAGYWAICSTLQITQNVQPQIAASGLVLTEN
jgi:hypothetical protein